PVRVTVFRWEVLALRDAPGGGIAEADVRIHCGGGTYIRSLARDLARAVGSAAHLTALRRVRSGPFLVEGAETLQSMREGHVVVQPALAALHGLPEQVLSEEELKRIVRGIDIAATVPGPWGALTNAESGILVALAERRDDRWQPRVVMREGDA
ncbi:MAG: tRNA pseudouridine(55) synthase TruB, partial [Gemmatimonadaceae bacterium]